MPDNKIEVFKMEDGHYENIRDNDETLTLKDLYSGYSLYNNITKTTMLYKENGLLSGVIDKNGNKKWKQKRV